jgi:hypothetical protein
MLLAALHDGLGRLRRKCVLAVLRAETKNENILNQRIWSGTGPKPSIFEGK